MTRLGTVHRALLDRWRHTMNLVGPGPIEAHFEDSTRALAALQPEGRWVDLGAGAGFPGLVLADRWPDLQVELVDSRQKRCAFLHRVLTEADVAPDRVTVTCARVETLTGPYDGLVARAFKAPPVVLDHAARLLRPRGTVVLMLQDEAAVPEDPRFSVEHVERYETEGRRRKGAYLSLG